MKELELLGICFGSAILLLPAALVGLYELRPTINNFLKSIRPANDTSGVDPSGKSQYSSKPQFHRQIRTQPGVTNSRRQNRTR